MKVENENQQVYVCKTGDKKKIYFNKSSDNFGSVYYSEKKIGSAFLLTTNILSYAYIRQFDHLVLSGGYKIIAILMTIFLGISVGMVVVFFRWKRSTEKEISVKKIKINQQELDHFMVLANVELDQNKGTIFVLILFSILSIVFFYFWGIISLLFAGMVLMSFGVFCLFEYDLKTRKNLYVKLQEMKIK